MSWAPILATMIPYVMNAINPGKDEKHGSTQSGTQISSIEQLLKDLQGMKGGAQDIKSNPQYMQGQEYLNGLFNDPQFFDKFEAPLQRQFNEQTVPDLANRFASQGSGGSLGSTGFRNQLAREGSNLSTNIASLRGGMQQQGVNQSLQYAQQPFNNYAQLMQTALTPYQNTYQGPSTGPWSGIAAQGIGAAGQYFANQPQSNPGQAQSTYQYPLTGGYDADFRNGRAYQGGY
jgi:hypothetical protein